MTARKQMIFAVSTAPILLYLGMLVRLNIPLVR
jgi:hypothetical protein